ncbi:MAG: penicillin-binding protein 2 [Candidatus Lambdaproteobacteria bacterium]|nr:penicillin-binding protein 2 [Candidatus Lambdaproteobacteria bacterium]
MPSLRLRLNNPLPPRFRGFRPRVLLVVLGLAFAGVVLAGRAFDLQVLQRATLNDLARRQSQRTIQVKGKRGPILDRFGGRLAYSVKAESVYARPGQIEQPSLAAFRLARALGLPREDLQAQLGSGRAFVWIKRQVTPAEAAAVRALEIKGVQSLPEYRRVYPQRAFAAALLGFTGVDGQGLEGLEYAYDSTLRGAQGERVIDKDALGRELVRSEQGFLSAGGSVTLTLHPAIQHVAEEELARAIELSEARQGVAIVMAATSGQILALAQAPGYNPNAYLEYDKETYFNRAITNGYEPGSTFKLITVAAALEEGLAKPDTLFFCENGEFRHYDSVIHDTEPHGWLPLSKVIALSSNICAAKLGLLVPAPVFHAHIARFGFGERMGVFTSPEGRRLAGEAEGRVLPPREWTPVDHAAISFGHGVLVSPLQLTAAVNAIATGGELLKPYLVQELRDPAGAVIQRGARTVVRRAISKQTAATLKQLMQGVVAKDGTGARAAIPGYTVAGKTGTTEKYDFQARGYSKTRQIASFVGFVPAESPALTILVQVEEPRRAHFGGSVSAPAMGRIAQRALPLLGVWPREGVRRVPLPKAKGG